LDKAVWRRFDRVIEFVPPSAPDQAIFVKEKLKSSSFEIESSLSKLIGTAFDKESFADSELWLNSCIRRAIIQNEDLQSILLEEISDKFVNKSPKEKAAAAEALINQGMSQRKASDFLQISRDTIRKYAKDVKRHREAL